MSNLDGTGMLRIPRVFWEDHQTRADVNPGRVERTLERFVVVDLTDVQREDLRSDAQHYADLLAEGGQTDPGMKRICRSAASTIAALAER